MECVVISINILKPEICFTILLTGNGTVSIINANVLTMFTAAVYFDRYACRMQKP